MKHQLVIIWITIITLSSCVQKSKSKTEVQNTKPVSYTTKVVVPELNIPSGMAFLPDASLLITEKTGELLLFKNKKTINIEAIPKVHWAGQGGLLDVAIHPNYKKNGWLYLIYISKTEKEKGSHTELMRAKIKNDSLVEKQVLYKTSTNKKIVQHFGSRITFDNDENLYFSIGDRANKNSNAQDITRDGGKIYRINDDGTIPTDNPFVIVPNAKTAIYSYGHRNSQGLTLHPKTGALWSNEHGVNGGDEINIIESGKNYGWPIITYALTYKNTKISQITEKEGMEQPLYYWNPSIAPSGMTFVTSDKYPNWKNNILTGSLKRQHLERLVLKDNKVINREILFNDIGRVRNVIEGPDGYLYIAVEGLGILKIIEQTEKEL